MQFAGLFVFELFLLYLLSQNITVLFSSFFYRLTRNKNFTAYLLAFIFLPGTFLHEFAHWLVARLLFVSTGQISLLPKLNGNSLRLGSVSVEKTDPFRRLMIGIAPVLIGVGIILTTLFYAFKADLFNNYWYILLLGYIAFEIGNTMFSSKKDMEGALGLLLFALFAGAICYLFGLRIPISSIEAYFSQSFVLAIFQQGSIYLLFPIIIDTGFILLLKIFHK